MHMLTRLKKKLHRDESRCSAPPPRSHQPLTDSLKIPRSAAEHCCPATPAENCTTRPRAVEKLAAEIRPADIDSVVRRARARRASHEKVVSPPGSAEKALVQPALHTVRRSFSAIYRSELPAKRASAGERNWQSVESYDFTLGRHIVVLEEQVWGLAQPAECAILRGKTLREATRELDGMERLGWAVTSTTAPTSAQSRGGYEIRLSRNTVQELVSDG